MNDCRGVVLAAFVAFGCAADEDVVLPSDSDLASLFAATDAVAGGGDLPTELRPLADAISSARLAREIGSLSEDRSAVFGEVKGVALRNDSLFVGDTQANSVKVFSLDGTYLTSFGQTGEGPSEFAGLAGFVALPEGPVVVIADRPGVQVFALDTANMFSERDRYAHDGFWPAAAGMHGGGGCVVGGRIAVRTIWPGWSDEPASLVQLLADQGEVLAAAFGETPYSSDYGIINAVASEGHIACDTVRGRVAVANVGLPFVQSFDIQTGRVAWTSRIEHSELARLVYNVQRRSAGVGPGLLVWNVVGTPAGHFVVQLAEPTMQSTPEGLITYLISGIDGRGARLDADLPTILHLSNRYMITQEPRPWIALGIYEID